MEKDKKVTALYCRLSKDDGSNSESLSIRTQKAMLMEYATRNGFGNCQYYVDDGYSGTNSDRPAFQELLDDIREGKVATVITKDQSRLGRNHIETGTYMEIFFPEHGVRYIAINDGYDSNEQSQMDIAPFRNIINEMYAKDTSRKIKSALRTRKKSGKYISSGAPFGYQKDPADHNHLVIDPNTAPVVEYIYSMAEEGLGLHRIAKRLHDEKVLKPCYYKKEMFGRFIDDEKMYDWDSAYISQVLHSPVYAGHIIYEAKPTVSMKSKKRRYIPFEERAIVPNTHEAIIPQDRWENVQRILYSRSGCFMCDKTDYDNIFKGIMTKNMKVRFCGGEFAGMDDLPEGPLVDVVVRPEDVIITKPEEGAISGEVVSVIFKGMHYEITIESGKYEMVIRTTKCYKVGDKVGMQLEPDGIHVMMAEDHTTSFVTTVNSDYTLDFNGKVINCNLADIVPKSHMKDGILVDENGETVDVSKIKVIVSLQPYDIKMSDETDAGLVSGKIIDLIYKGDHYSYVIRDEYGHDLIVDDEYLWNMDDQVGLIMPEDKMKFQIKK